MHAQSCTVNDNCMHNITAADCVQLERRRAERLRVQQLNNLSEHDRKLMLAREMADAKDLAKSAKSKGDNAAKKRAGDAIKRLKQEVGQMGTSEEELAQMLVAEKANDAAFAGAALFYMCVA